MNKPKIAVLIDWYLPGTKAGGPVRSVYSLVNLLKDDYDFYIVTTNYDLGSPAPYTSVAANTLFVKDGVHYYYFSREAVLSKNMRSLLSEIDPDLIYLNSFWSFSFSISLVNLRNNNTIASPILLAPRGMLGKGAMSLKSLKKRIFLGIAKRLGWYKRITFHATQQQEENDIKTVFSAAKVLIAPNVNSSPVVENKSVKTKAHLKLFFLSRIAEVKNLHFALEVLKNLPKEYTVEYDIYGNLEDQAYWNSCKKIIDELPAHVSATYKGELQFNEVQDTICHYNCLFLPTLNENFGHSIVESLLCGCPVITSDQTPWNDLAEYNAGFAIALNNRQAFLAAVIQCAELTPEAFAQKSQSAISYISKKIDMTLIKNQYKKLFNECIKKN